MSRIATHQDIGERLAIWKMAVLRNAKLSLHRFAMEAATLT